MKTVTFFHPETGLTWNFTGTTVKEALELAKRAGAVVETGWFLQ